MSRRRRGFIFAVPKAGSLALRGRCKSPTGPTSPTCQPSSLLRLRGCDELVGALGSAIRPCVTVTRS